MSLATVSFARPGMLSQSRHKNAFVFIRLPDEKQNSHIFQ
jgi:hypothetical protein